MTDRPLCINPVCTTRGQHYADCQDDQCRGCLPRLAYDGKYLCMICTKRIGEDALTCARLYQELAKVLTGSGGVGQRTSGTPNRGLNLNPRAIECRDEIRARLAMWCLRIAQERGFTPPVPTVAATALYVERNAGWLAGHRDIAGEVAEQLHDASHGVAWSTAYPTGARRFPVGPCLEAECEGEIVAILRDTDQLLPSVLRCSVDDEHEWTASTWTAIGRALHPDGATGRYVSAHEIGATFGLPLGTVWRLASTERWRRTEDGRRPVLYLASDVDATMKFRAERGVS